MVPDRNPTPVEVTMRVGHEFSAILHTDSTATIAQAGVLGDSYVDIELGPRQRTAAGQQRRVDGLRLAQHPGRDPHQQ